MTIIFPYRNRELDRIKKCFDSLAVQTNQNFDIIFVDYGSEPSIANQVKTYVSQFPNLKYIYSYCQFQPWSRAKAINIGIKAAKTVYVFITDIDMIFREDFVEILHEIKNPKQSVYFKVGFLSEAASKKQTQFENYKISFESGKGAQGLSLFPTKALNDICGFDEFLHFWGAEDEDIHNRLMNIGLEEIFYNSEILMLHQWHKNYRRSESKDLSVDLRINNITRINDERLKFNKNNSVKIVNSAWGRLISKTEFDSFNSFENLEKIVNIQEKINHFLFSELPNIGTKVIAVKFEIDDFQHSFKFYIKKILRKTVPKYYSLKEINDKVLLHIISFYHNFNYIYKVSDDKKSIQFIIQK